SSPWKPEPRLSPQLLSQFVEQPVQVLVLFSYFVDLLDRMEDRGVVLAAELASDLWQGSLGQMFSQIHCNLPGIHDGPGIVFGLVFFCRMATLVSRSVGWISAMSPHSKRLRRRSSISANSFGGRSLAITICFIDSCRALNVWKNSSWVLSFCARNWISSISN